MKLKKDPKYIYWGLTALCVVVLSIVIATVLSDFTGFFASCKKLLSILSPVVYGIAIAYLLNPIMVFFERYLLVFLRKRKKLSEKAVRSFSRGLSVVGALLVGSLVVYGFFALLLPNLIDSITGIVTNMPEYYKTVQNWIQELSQTHPEYSGIINNFSDKAFEGISVWVQEKLLNNWETLVITVTSQVYVVIKSAMNLLIGVVAAVYMLISKEKFQAQMKKIVVAVMRRERADRLLEVCSHSNKVFSGFISGKILDSMIIGVLCYIGMRILKMPFPELIATIVGVTNVIPFFGPIIGAVPSALLILLVSPLKAVYFLIFVLALQQVDGNLIGPHILGDAVGLPSFWILVSITFFGGLFGFSGMLLGVPVFAVIYMLVREFVEERLKKKGAPVSTEYYYHMSRTEDLEHIAEPPEQDETDEHISEEELEAAEQEFWK